MNLGILDFRKFATISGPALTGLLVVYAMGSSHLMSEAAGKPEWVEQIQGYPVGQSDPFADEIHRFQSLKLTQNDRTAISVDNPEWEDDPAHLTHLFDHCYQSLQLKFDPIEYEERGLFIFEKDFVPHEVKDLKPGRSNRTYSLHIDRYADPKFEGEYRGVLLIVPGTGSYGGNYVKFATVMAGLKGYIVYTIDSINHGRSHGHKLIRRTSNGAATGVFLNRAITKEGTWQFSAGLEQGWEEVESTRFSMDNFITCAQEVGRRIAHREKENLKHLSDRVLTKDPEARSEDWYGKPANLLTHVTLIGTSQGGETAFWASDPRATGRGGQATHGILYPFDSVICHNVYNTAYTAPQKKMRWLRSGFPGCLISKIIKNKDSLWENANWWDYYSGSALFVRSSDRWVRWRYNMNDYRDLLRFGQQHAGSVRQAKIPVLVAIGSNDALYPSDRAADKVVQKLFNELERDELGESLWYVKYNTPAGMSGHQLLVQHTLPFANLVDAWIRYRRGGPGSSFQYHRSGEWRRVE